MQAKHVKYHKNLAHRAKSMNFGVKVSKTKKKSLILGPSKNYIVWRQNDVIMENLTSLWRHCDVRVMHFAGAKNQTFAIGLRNLHTKNHAFSTICEIFTPSSPTKLLKRSYKNLLTPCTVNLWNKSWIINCELHLFLIIS